MKSTRGIIKVENLTINHFQAQHVTTAPTILFRGGTFVSGMNELYDLLSAKSKEYPDNRALVREAGFDV